MISNFDVSVVLPFYKKMKDFEITLKVNHPYFQRNGIEVVVVMDEPSEQNSLLSLIKRYPFITWRVIVNENPHNWRNPSKAINVGIRLATKKYILVMGPDSEMANDIILEMRSKAEFYKNSFFVGRVAFVDYNYCYTKESEEKLNFLYYGSLFAEKKDLVLVNGYNEEYDKWGGDDDNIRARLQMRGIKKIKLPFCLLIHREDEINLETTRRREKAAVAYRDTGQLKDAFVPDTYLANAFRTWGQDFDKVIYDWKRNPYARELCESYLSKEVFSQFEIKNAAFQKHYKTIALVPTYNERQNIPDLLIHLDKYCDGIILLDDASDDETYDLAESDKLILKAQKKRHGFNDLLNRNCLLDIAHFFQCEYYFFIDADERFDDRYADLYAVVDSGKSETFCFHLVHLWDSQNNYRVDVPERSQVNQPGVLQRWRMFKNIGRMNIKGDRLHFAATPYKTKKVFAPILIKHYGLIDKETRQFKYHRYHQEDEKLHLNPNKYNYFLDEQITSGQVSDIILEDSYQLSRKKEERGLEKS